MEDLKNRMSFNNRAIQTQAVWKLYTEVTKKTTKHGKLEIGAPESLEVKLLWEKCGAVENVVAKSVCHALVQLVSDNHAEFSYILNGFLNLVPSVKNLSGIVAGIGELLILQVAAAENQGHSYVCPFRLRTPPHPFITIVTNRPESWSLLQNQIYTICCHGNKSVRSQALTMLSPFLKFILLEPQQSVQYQPMRNSLHRALLQAAVQSHDEDVSNNIIRFMASVLPCSQLSDAESIAMACQYLTDILHHFGLRGSSTCLDRQIQSLIEYGLTLYNLCLQHSLEVTQLSHVLMFVADNKPKLLRTDRTVMTLATLLLSSPPDSLHSLLYLCDKVMQVEDEGDSVPMSVRCLILPTLQVLATPSTQLSAHLWKSLKTLAGKIIKMVENSEPFSCKKQITDIEPTASTDSRCGFTQFIQEIDKYAKLSIHVFSNGQISVSWLTSLISSLKLTSHIPFCLTNIVCGLLTQSRSVEESKLALQVSVVIANRQAEQAVLFLHVLLYQLFRETQPDVKLEILNTIPLLATHKICVPPILKTIQSFGKLPRMKACAITMITSLWKLQDRCFPHLLKMVTEDASRNNPGTTGFDEVMLARAKTIRDVCKLRPEQHGSDLLAPLSDILDVCTGEGEAPIAALALEGLYYLCEAEVINIQSAWSVLAEKLIQDTRPAVVEKICELFSLVPVLDVKGQEYEKFIDDTVQNLWLFTNSGDSRVCGAAYQALAMYKADQFKLSYLPRQVTEEFAEQALVIAKQQDPETTSVNIDDVITFVPGVCYLKLLKTVHPDVLQHYEAFLSAMVAKEVENLPRGIYHSSLQRHGAAANQGKAVSSIPGFIMAQYEKTKQPGLRPGLAAGLLFGYDPPVEVGRDGRPRKHYIISHGKNFQQMFSTLLHEVPIQPSEWHRSMLIPQAWTSFVDRLFVAVLEWRKAEIDLQLKRDHIDEDEARDNKEVAWLWVRDTLVDTIKSASRGNPTMQGNSVYALAGLAVTVNRYLTGLDQDVRKAAEDSTEYTSPSHWLTVVMDTVMSLMDINFVPKGSLLGLCQQRSVDDRLPASILAQASASVSLSQLVPALITLDVDRIYDIITFLANRLPSSPTCPDSVVLQFHAGLGLGMFLARLSEEHFADISGTKGMLQVWKNLDLLEECCFSGNIENRSGALLGLGLAVCAMCEEGKTDSRAHVSVVCEKLFMLCEKSDVTDNSYQALSVCTSCVYGAAFSSNIIQITQVNAIVDWLMSAHSSNPQITGVSLALGMLCYTLSKVGHPGIADIRRGLFVNWIKQLGQEDSSPMLKVSVLNGLMALIGSERTLIPIQSNASSLEGDLNTDDVIKMASHIVTSGNDLGIQSNSAWMLGHLYLSACAVADTRASVPSNYSYLPEQSFLRAMVDFLTEAGKLGPEFIPKEQVKVALSSLHDEVQHTLPPVNWAGILTPMIRLDFGADVSCLSLKLAVKQSCTAPTAAMFLTSWATPPLYNTLHVSCQMALFDSLSQLMICLAPNVLKTLLEHGSNHLLLESAKRDPELSRHILLGLCQALKVHDPPEAMVTVLHNAVEVFYCILQSPSQFAELTAIAECLGNVPDTFFDRLTEEDFLQNRQDKGCLVRCFLVAQGRQPLAVLNRCIDASFNNPKCDLDLVLKLLQRCLYQMCQSKSEFTGVLQRIQWFVELLGHIRNIATGVITLSGEVKDLSKVMDFAIEVVSSAVSLWTSNSSACLLGLHSSLLTCPDSKHNDDTDQSLGVVWKHHSGSWYLPVYIRGLEVEPWDQVLPKMIDWLVTMTTLPSSSLNSQTRDTLKASLLVLRQSTVFRKPAVWTGTYDSL